MPVDLQGGEGINILCHILIGGIDTGREKNPVDPLGFERLYIFLFPLDVSGSAKDAYGISLLIGRCLDAFQERRKEDAGDGRYDHGDGVGSAAFQPPGNHIYFVVQLFHCAHDAFLKRPAYRFCPVQYIGYRGDRYIGVLCYILNPNWFCFVRHIVPVTPSWTSASLWLLRLLWAVAGILH